MGALCLQIEQSGGGIGGCLMERDMALLTLEALSRVVGGNTTASFALLLLNSLLLLGFPD